MAIPSGLSASLGFKAETTWGTAVTVDRWVPLVSESLAQEIERLESAGIIAGRRVLDSEQWEPGAVTVSGDVQVEAYTNSIGLLLHHALGSVNTTGSGTFTHVLTPGDLTGKGLTVQVGRPDVTGTVRPFTYAGCKVASWELALAAGEIATLNLSMVGKSETTDTVLASPSYAAGSTSPFVYTGGTVLVAPAATPIATKVRSITINGDNGLSTDRMNVGQSTIDEPLEADLRTYAGEIELEFSGLTAYDRFVDADEVIVELILTKGSASLEISMNCRFDGSTPSVDGRDLLVMTMPFKAIGTTDAEAITATLINTDATP